MGKTTATKSASKGHKSFPGRRVDLLDLPGWTSWPARLLGLETFLGCRRTLDKIEQEYDRDKFARCLEYARSLPPERLSPEEVRAFEQDSSEELTCVARGNKLFAISAAGAIRQYDEILTERMRSAIEEVRLVVELGCGFGYHLWNLAQRFPNKLYTGGDYSENAVHLAALLFRDAGNIKVKRLNLYSPRYELLHELADSGPMIIYTVHAVEQLASATPLLNALSAHRSQIRAVFHFEPANELHSNSLLGLLRRRYAEVNDYNRDLVSRLRERPEISIVRLEEHVYGSNPLNPISVIQWEFSKA